MDIEELRKLLSEARAQMRALVDTAKAESRSLTSDEAARFDELEQTIEARKADVRRAEVAEAEARADEKAREERAAEARKRLGMGDGPDVTVRSEERTYRKGGQHSYFNDLCSSTLGNPAAQARLARHAHEMEVEAREKPAGIVARTLSQVEGRMGIESRAGLTTAVGSGGTFLPPEYLLDEYVAFPRPERVLADLVRKQDLPRGPMTINIPKVTAGTAVASQNGQNTAATETDLTDAYVSANVNTIAGNQTVSLQAIEQSSVPFDEIVFQDLIRALDAQIEYQVIQGSNSNGQFQGLTGLSGVNSVTYTDSAPSGVKAYPFLGQAKALVFDSIHRPADAIFMTPDRWAWFETAADSQGRPLVVPSNNGPFNAIGTVDGQLKNGPMPVGMVFGLPVYVDSQIPTNLGASTNQDEILVVSTKDLILWESAPVSRALPQTLGNQLSVLLQVYEYAAFMPNRLPGATSVIGGTGLTPPSF